MGEAVTLASAGAALLKAGSSPLRDVDVTVLRANVIASGLDRGTFDWENPETVTTVKGSLQPATSKERRLAGLVTEQGEFAVYLDRVELSPGYYRLQIGTQQYEIVGAAVWPSHTLCIVEAL